MSKWILRLVALAVLGVAVGLWLTRAETLPEGMFAGLDADPARGALVFWAAGCASCHAAPDASGAEKLVLAGGKAFPSPFGTFYAPNISTDKTQGLGQWTLADLGNAMMRGTSPEGRHYFPAFPYASYINSTPQDVADLWAFLQTLPASDAKSRPHDVGFPFNIRRGLGGWKLLFLQEGWVIPGDLSEPAARGRYLVEALGHCGECHTPRNMIGGLQKDQWLAGAPDPSGRGRIPNVTPAKLTWSAVDIAAYLKSGFTPDFDSAGGHMADVIDSMAHLPDSDHAAIAEYLKLVPAKD